MSLSNLSSEKIKIEKDIQININSKIDEFKSFVFKSGAGAGKTYALIESLKYIVTSKSDFLERNNKQIICITYTNVATNEVKIRLGHSSLILVSTIHERIWDLIKLYQDELVKIHKEKVLIELNNSEVIKNNSPIFISLEDNYDAFKKIALENKELFYKNYKGKAKTFRENFGILFKEYYTISNADNFKKFIKNIYKIENLNDCLKGIEDKKNGYKKVEYDSKINDDRLYRMKISHDTLLEYGLKIIQEYPVLQKILIDKYPYILIDEYQDTNENVVKIMSCLESYSKKNSLDFLVGYFGDPFQNIYETGVGKNLEEIHEGLFIINKKFNRRSTIEVIDIINRIKQAAVEDKQESIYEDCTGGNIQFKQVDVEDIDEEINNIVSLWEINEKNKLHCLVLTNELLAQYCNFYNFFNCFKPVINYNQIKTELLSTDKKKLGEIPLYIYNIINFYCISLIPNTTICSLIFDNTSKENQQLVIENLTISNIRNLISKIEEFNGVSFRDLLQFYEEFYESKESIIFNKIIDYIFDIKDFSVENIEIYLLNKLYNNLDDDEKIDEAKVNISKLLDLKLSEYIRWYNFINEKQSQMIEYHTYHGTKGLEFDNEIIIMGNKFGKEGSYFNFYFENYGKENELSEEDREKYYMVQNLLYVACSRAIYNLEILYTDDISLFEESIKTIFNYQNT